MRDQDIDATVSHTLELLKSALTEAQTTVRAYDTKAQIVGVGYIFALGIVSQVDELLPTPSSIGHAELLAIWFVVIAPILLFGNVLSPKRKTVPKTDTGTSGDV